MAVAFERRSARNKHEARVARVASQIRRFHAEKRKFRIYHGSTNSTRSTNFQRDAIVDTSDFTQIIRVDEATQTALIEPNVPMDRLVRELADVRFVPPVVMEFPGITVGGGFSGTSGESSSFKYGVFEQTVKSIEIVLANGDIMHASMTENPELFHGAAGAFGTLGVVTLLELHLLPARKFVELTYIPSPSIPAAIAEISRLIHDESSSSYDFVDGIIYSPTEAIIMAGRLTNTPSVPETPIRSFLRSTDPWLYQHAYKRAYPRSAEAPSPVTDLIPAESYFFRYDRGAFWAASYAFTYFLTPFNAVTRFLLNPLMHARVMFRAMARSALNEQYILQDVVLPLCNIVEFIDWSVDRYGIFPLWLCPLHKRRGVRPFADAVSAGEDASRLQHPHQNGLRDPRGDSEDFVCNVGIWGGARIPDYAEFVRENRAIERKVAQLGGIKTLYAQAFYTEEEFAQIYDVGRWERLRSKYGAEGLPSVWEKVTTRTRPEDLDWRRRAKSWWPVGGMYGILCLFLGDEGLFERERSLLGLVSLAVVALAGLIYAYTSISKP